MSSKDLPRIFTPPPVGVAEYCCEHVCLFVRLCFVRSRAYPRKCTPDLHQSFCACYLFRGDSIFLWWRCDMSCVSCLWMASYLHLHQTAAHCRGSQSGLLTMLTVRMHVIQCTYTHIMHTPTYIRACTVRKRKI